MNDLEGCSIFLLLLLVVAIIIFGPLVSIWAINTLFGLTIPMNIATWFAALWLGGIGTALRSRSKD